MCSTATPTTAAQATTSITTQEAQHRAYLSREAITKTTPKAVPTTRQAVAVHHRAGAVAAAAEVSLVVASQEAVSPVVEAEASLVEAVIVAKAKFANLTHRNKGCKPLFLWHKIPS